jgi:tetratricopeptide (TPR) repeat protein
MRILEAGIAGVVLVGAAAPVVAQRPATTMQQDFDAATALADKGDDAGALAAWQALEKRTPAKNRRTMAIIRVRMGAALYKLNRMDEAVVAVRAGLAELPVSDATLTAYRYDAYFQLAQIAESGLDYASAVENYRVAESIGATPVERLSALRGLIASGTFVDPERAVADVARAEAILAATATDAKGKALFAALKSVLLLNLGRYTEARFAAGEAVKLLGGLTSKTDLYDVAARSDYSIAALLEGRREDARRYMAMTGAGRLPDSIFATGVQMKPPGCSESGLSPDDAAVIEFSIGDDGTVVSSMPVYAAGGGAAGLVFARAARSWSWTPEQVKTMPIFFRYRVRLEMRCSTAFARPSIDDYMSSRLDAWLIGKGVALQPAAASDSDAVALPKQRARLAAAEAAQGKTALTLVPMLYAIVQNSVVGREETNLLARRAVAIADANGVTSVARVALSRIIWRTDQADRWKGGAFLHSVEPALSDPAFNDPEARAAIRLTLVDALDRKEEKKARQLLQDIGAESALAPNDPLRVGALIRLASLEEANGNAEAARTAFDKSGLSARQCALVDSAPKPVRFGGNGSDFPKEALSWGFEGWVLTQFDVTADGLVQSERPIMAYPPFVFSKAGAGVIAKTRFEKTYRPDGGLGCGSNTMRTGFRIDNSMK